MNDSVESRKQYFEYLLCLRQRMAALGVTYLVKEIDQMLERVRNEK